jgi:radical SAM superfamily enzyme YgiQ (UPF0313 family)
MGLAYLAGYVHSRGADRFSVRILDMMGSHEDVPQLVASIVAQQPKVVGFSVVTGNVGVACDMARHLRGSLPDVHLVAGGPHATVRPADLASAFDAVVVREGEESFWELLNSYRDGSEGSGIPGVWLPNAPELFVERPLLRSLDQVPPPDRDSLSLSSYYHSYPHRTAEGYPNFTTVFTSRGCAHNCGFCGNRKLWQSRVRYFGLARVKEELDEVTSKHRVGLVFFDDDSFTASRQRVLSLCQLIRDEYPYLKWVIHARVDQVDPPLLAMMKQSGLVEIQFGLESGDQEILDAMGKGIRLEQAEAALRWCRELGIRTWGTFVLGYPGETERTLRRTLSFAKRINPSYASFIPLLPFPGSAVFDELEEKGRLLTRNWDDYSWYRPPVFHTPQLEDKTLLAWVRKGYLEFYLRPSKLLEILGDLLASRSHREMLRDVHAWWSIVTK